MRVAPAVGLVTAAALFGDTLLYSALPVSAARLGLDALAVGLVLSLNRWVRLLTNPFAARLYQRFPAGALILVALALAVASTAVYSLPTVLIAFFAARLVWGMAWSLLRLGTLLAAIENAAGRAGRALGDIRAVYGLGYFGGALYAPFAVESFGWGGAALGAAVLTLALGIGPAVALAGWRRHADVDEREEEAVRRAITDPRFTPLFAVAALQYGVYPGIIGIAGGLRVGEIFAGGGTIFAIPASATVIAGAYILSQRISQVLWTPFAGRFADRSLTVTFAASTVAAAAAVLALTFTYDASAFVTLGAVAFFAGITSTVALELAIAHRTTAGDRPRVLGAYSTWADAGAASGALGAGFLAHAGTQAPFAVAALLAAATLAIAPRIAVRAVAVGASAP